MVTSARLKSSKDLRRPFAPAILRRAREIAAKYQIVIWEEDGYVYGRGVELPTTFGGGKTLTACVAETREGFATTVAHMLENDQVPPPPATDELRTEQVNLRVTKREKLQLEVAAKRRGFRGVSDYVRSTALGD